MTTYLLVYQDGAKCWSKYTMADSDETVIREQTAHPQIVAIQKTIKKGKGAHISSMLDEIWIRGKVKGRRRR